ncbi:MAG TPA: helix-turn-helix domain-containing protein [Jiangellaceae bacterium]|nr:helix-turn-helix domain-containing protein [Jiangellaceae bacterium]
MALSRKQVTDVDTLRALAHPLRVQLLGALRLDGPATASELGRRFGESSGSTSYHLRQLERFGFVAEDDEQPSRRERRWRAAHDVTSFRPADFLDEDAGREALEVMESQQLRFLLDTVQAWHRAKAGWPRAWVSAAEQSDLHLWLSAAELAQMNQELLAVVQGWIARQRRPTDPDARQVSLYLLTVPRVAGDR